MHKETVSWISRISRKVISHLETKLMRLRAILKTLREVSCPFLTFSVSQIFFYPDIIWIVQCSYHLIFLP